MTIDISYSLEKNPLLLDTKWEETVISNGYFKFAIALADKSFVTVKIFNNEEEYNEYQNANK